VKLIDHWRQELNKLWTIRVAIFGGLLAVADQILGAFEARIPPIIYALLMVIIVVVRLTYQKPPDAPNP